MPAAIEAGISYFDFFHMTLATVKMHIHVFAKRKQEEMELIEYKAWLNGYFVMYATGANFSKKIKYPENPLKENRVVVEDMELTEEEKIEWKNKIFGKLYKMGEKVKRRQKEISDKSIL